MKKLINQNQFHDAFKNMNRSNNFSYKALDALFNYLTQLEDECDMEIELDVIRLCGEYSEWDLDECLKYYSLENIEQLRHRTTVIEIEGTTSVVVEDY